MIRQSFRLPIVSCALFFPILCLNSSVLAEDVVHLRRGEVDGDSYSVRGEIRDWTGAAIIVERNGGAAREYAADRVVRVETNWPEEYEAGRQSLADGQHDAAIAQLERALRIERRTWARRRIMHDLMLAYEAQGNLELAGDLFLALVELDPQTPTLRDAPLAWFPLDGFSRPTAAKLLAGSDRPAGVLLGASHLLATSDRPRAQLALGGLLDSDDPRIAALAEAQLWRTRLTDASLEDVRRWSARVETMPQEIRAGPYFVVAEGFARLGQVDDAVLAYLRIPIHAPTRRALAARALASAARLSYKAGQIAQATRLLHEAVTEYADSPETAAARQLLEQLESEPRN